MQNVIKTIESVIINAHLSKAFDLSKKKVFIFHEIGLRCRNCGQNCAM